MRLFTNLRATLNPSDYRVESSAIVDNNDYREILSMYPLKKIHEHLNGPGAQSNDNAGRSEVLDVIAADVANDINDSSKNIGEGLHRVNAQISDEADHLKI